MKLREEVECLQEQLIEAKSTKEKELESSRRSKKETLLLQEQLNELKKRETELSHKLKATVENFKYAIIMVTILKILILED